MKKFLLSYEIAFVYVIHQDNWNWSKTDVMLGSTAHPAWHIMRVIPSLPR